MTVDIRQGDCVSVLRTLDAGSVHACVTSPPYFGLRDYGVDGQIGLEDTPDAYVARLVAAFREVRRVLRDDGTLWLNLGDSYTPVNYGPNAKLRRESAGSADTIQGRGKHWAADIGGKRSHELHKGCRSVGLKSKDLIGTPWRVAFALQADGWYLRQDIIWSKPNPMPESVRDRCTKAHEYIFLLSKREKYYFDSAAMKEPGVAPAGTRGAKGSVEHQAQPGVNARPPAYKVYDGLRNRRSVWTVPTRPFKGAHFATFPPDLITPCVLAGCPPGGVVLDPFGGAGTTGVVAQRYGRRAILCELNPEYVDLARKRIAADRSALMGGLS